MRCKNDQKGVIAGLGVSTLFWETILYLVIDGLHAALHLRPHTVLYTAENFMNEVQGRGLIVEAG